MNFLQSDSIDKKSLPEQISDRIIVLIQSNSLKPNEKLPTERALAETLNVSRQSVRDALKILCTLGFIVNKQGSGNYVSPLKSTNLLKQFHFFITLDRSNIDHLFETRIVIEKAMIEKAVQNVGDEDIDRLEQILISQAYTLDDSLSFRISDADFHQKIADISQNSFYKQIIIAIDELCMAYRLEVTKDSHLLKKSFKQHQDIVEALKKRNKSLAIKAMEKHINFIYKTTKEKLFTIPQTII